MSLLIDNYDSFTYNLAHVPADERPELARYVRSLRMRSTQR
jgi:anthranilate/para-aminobenzoate synthase component II